MRPDRVTYVYCLVQASAPDFVGAPAGLVGAGSPRLLEVEAGLWVVVADAPVELYGADAIERRLRDVEWVSACAVAHQALLEHFLGADALVPMKLFTLFSSDARALDDFRARRAQLDAILGAVRGCHEWGLRVLFDEERALRQQWPASVPASGTDFLLRKKAQRDAAQRAAGEGRERAVELYEALAARAQRACSNDDAAAGPGRLVLDAAFLVQAVEDERFRAAVQERAAALEPKGFDLLLTGPWPPYNFVGDAP